MRRGLPRSGILSLARLFDFHIDAERVSGGFGTLDGHGR
jgi:hypothetical protein